MIRRASIMLVGALMGATAMSVVYSAGVPAEAAGNSTYKELAIFGDVFERVRAQYVTPPDEKKLVEAAINGMLSSLDPHSSYMNAQEAADMQTQTKGEFGGIGIEVTMENDLVKVITPIDDTPGAKAGILAGDMISEINGTPVRGMQLNDAVEKMRGAVNTPIKLTILRKGADKPIEMSVMREIIPIRAVKSRVDGDVGYVRVISFTEKTYDDLEAAINKIKKEVPADKLKGFVLDLRLNPGGLLDQAIYVSDAFLQKGEIVSTRSRDPEDTRRFNATAGDLTDGKPLIVLVNGGSASASEIVAGALQDLKRATVVGTRSFGKGSVQTIIPMGDKGALRLTTALYYTPSGKSIQGTGIHPDIKVEEPLPADLQGKLRTEGESSLPGHIQGQSETEEGSGSVAYVPPDPKDDVQLNYALDLLRGAKTDPSFPPDPSKAVLESAKKK
ncbi:MULTISPECIES: S41 family peptidase [Rhizobium/Agrobacterium group]|uniref:S41 family peptidase n=1 Tax=Rhizobium/Agrobacterium group TaxID=227290 RepID=UPI0012E93BFF|nr:MULTISPECIES: S41 family peptidase [Rhizobium/Agrobacterium group]MCF1446911.1 S41 family peptidase [Allorhizobium ampelinum]MCF1491810.1 S41 family peptidase [Allorhizobium ampelinum]MVA24256.1 PDZ domain-containing protein [Agrobacterium vitis]MVA46122.1 PDZ domain-containing protein [Agrobacterium vitis]MVA62174.1 PDZ domain-containing protein [Agrobacterium vitis]